MFLGLEIECNVEVLGFVAHFLDYPAQQFCKVEMPRVDAGFAAEPGQGNDLVDQMLHAIDFRFDTLQVTRIRHGLACQVVGDAEARERRSQFMGDIP